MSKTKPIPAALTRKQLSRAERERRLQRYIWIGAGVLAALLVIIVAAGLLDLFVFQPQQAVARVDADIITTERFQRAVRYRRWLLIGQYSQIQSALLFFGSDPQTQSYFESQLQQVVAELNDSTSLGRQVLNDLVDDHLIRQEAGRRGITVTAEEVEARLQAGFRYYPNGTPTPTITPTEPPTYVPPTVNPTAVARWTPTATLTPAATFTPTVTPTLGPSPTAPATSTPLPTATPFSAEAYATSVVSFTNELQAGASLSLEDQRYFLESEIYREKVTAAISADVPNTEEQTHARHILVPDEAIAIALKARLDAGDDWDTLAAEYSTDTSNKLQGGDLGWFGRGAMVPEFEQVAFILEVGLISDPVKSQFGWHLIQVLGREERPLDSSALEQKRQQAFDDWLAQKRQETRADGTPLFELYDVWTSRVPDTPQLPTALAQP
jgi:parvulin-like peptidyl-prolyl isomerase